MKKGEEIKKMVERNQRIKSIERACTQMRVKFAADVDASTMVLSMPSFKGDATE